MKIAMCFMVLLMPIAAQAQCSEGTAPTVIAAGSAIGPVALSDGGMPDDRVAPQRAKSWFISRKKMRSGLKRRQH